jgi:predicted phage tail protein
MVEVRLHGPLSKSFGQKWMLDIQSPIEAVHAIEANKPGLRKLIRQLSNKGMVFRVRSKDHDYDETDISTTLGRVQRIDIIPIVKGASAGVRFVVGAILVVTGIIYANPYLTSIGASLMVGAVVEWLTPIPKPGETTSSSESWTLNGPSNTADQGSPVPIIYGEVLAGGYPVSAGISASQFTLGGSVEPSVYIVGETVVSQRARVRGDSNEPWGNRAELRLSANTYNLGDPLTFAWTYSITTDQPDVTSVSLSVGELNKQTLSVNVTLFGMGLLPVEGSDTAFHHASGSITVVVTGLEQDREGSGTPDVLTRTQTVPVDLYYSLTRWSGGS